MTFKDEAELAMEISSTVMTDEDKHIMFKTLKKEIEDEEIEGFVGEIMKELEGLND